LRDKAPIWMFSLHSTSNEQSLSLKERTLRYPSISPAAHRA